MLFLYTVVQGDTLEKIAEKFCTDLDTILDLNSIGDTVVVGQRLLIQSNLSVPQWMKNGTLWFDELDCRQLSRLMHRCTNRAQNSNDTESISSSINKETNNLCVENVSTTNPSELLPKENNEEADLFCRQRPFKDDFVTKHTVAEGESISSIAMKYGVTVRMLNKCGAPLEVFPGDVLGIPTVSGRRFFYTVRIGDNIEKIAGRFGCSKEKLQNVNFLDDLQELVPGEQLLILV